MKSVLYAIICLITLQNCGSFNNNQYAWATDSAAIAMDTISISDWTGHGEILPQNYKSSRNSLWDLKHTNLYVNFDFDRRRLKGTAEITLQLRFYPTDSLILDAKKMDIESVVILEGENQIPVTFSYPDSMQLKIRLPKTYEETNGAMPIIKTKIVYTAKPYESESGGGNAVTSDRGLYFINHNLSNPAIPRQIWTQGETESSSRWFPTIDAPNQKMTQKIAMILPDSMVSLSNGLLISSKKTGNGMREDIWEQKLPHAPYLAMMAIGDWAVIKDKWRNKTVDYYVEKPFAADAQRIFGKTPEMMEFFSTYTGVDFPWDKYSQVVVRDFVSGAMENTSATVHMEALQTTAAEYRDNSYEDYVSHELFHHWFGDLVTAESWSNITLNESFATYGEYLWREHKYGKEYADELLEEFQSYESLYGTASAELVRYNYHKPDDVFDIISYQKGALILHMLRHEIGDKAFRAGIKKYLTNFSYQSAEVSQLRMAFESVTGKDLSMFFNQWYFTGGKPRISLAGKWTADSGIFQFNITQEQQHRNTYTFKTSLKLQLGNEIKIIPLEINSREFSKNIHLPQKPDYWVFDPENQLLAIIDYVKTDIETGINNMKMLQNAMLQENNPAIKLNLLSLSKQIYSNNDFDFMVEPYNTLLDSIVIIGLQNEWSPLQMTSINLLNQKNYNNESIVNILKLILEKSHSPSNRAAAMNELANLDTSIYQQYVNDASPYVATQAIKNLPWEQRWYDTAMIAIPKSPRNTASAWTMYIFRQDTGIHWVKALLALSKNKETGLEQFGNYFGILISGGYIHDENTHILEYLYAEASKSKNTLLLKSMAHELKPMITKSDDGYRLPQEVRRVAEKICIAAQ